MNATQRRHLEVLRRMEGSIDGLLFRLPGGFWTVGGVPTARTTEEGYEVPAWSVGKVTVMSLERRFWIERLHHHREDWRDPRKLTAEGRAHLKRASRRNPDTT